MISALDLINLFYVTALCCFIYSWLKFGIKFALIEFLIAFLFGLSFETFNINIGQHYSYPFSYFFIDKVPISIIVTWYAIFMLGKFWTLQMISYQENSHRSIRDNLPLIPIIIITNAFIATTLVLLIDPIATQLRWWEWIEPAPYLNVPIGELYGIFIAISMIGGIYWPTIIILKIRYNFPSTELIGNRQQLDLLIVILYQIVSLLLLYGTMITAVDENDVLMGALVAFLATQVILFVNLILFMTHEDFSIFIMKIHQKNSYYLPLAITIGFFLGSISLLLSFLAMFNIDILILPPIRSLHMILAQFSIVFFAITFSILFKYMNLSMDSKLFE